MYIYICICICIYTICIYTICIYTICIYTSTVLYINTDPDPDPYIYIVTSIDIDIENHIDIHRIPSVALRMAPAPTSRLRKMIRIARWSRSGARSK